MSDISQLIIAPILLPLITAAMMLLLGEKHRHIKARLNLLSTFSGLVIAVCLLLWVRTRARQRRSGCTCRATGRRHSASCWWWTTCPRSC